VLTIVRQEHLERALRQNSMPDEEGCIWKRELRRSSPEFADAFEVRFGGCADELMIAISRNLISYEDAHHELRITHELVSLVFTTVCLARTGRLPTLSKEKLESGRMRFTQDRDANIKRVMRELAELNPGLGLAALGIQPDPCRWEGTAIAAFAVIDALLQEL